MPDSTVLAQRLANLIDKANKGHWSVDDDISWSRPLADPAGGLASNNDGPFGAFVKASKHLGICTELESVQFGRELRAWLVSQLLYMEQAALSICGASIGIADNELCKYSLALQCSDEVRHALAFQRYLERTGLNIADSSSSLGIVSELVLQDGRFDVILLGLQVGVESVALSLLGDVMDWSIDPLLSEICRYVLSDEARHVGLAGILLPALYAELTSAEIRERCEIAGELRELIRHRYIPTPAIQALLQDDSDCAIQRFLKCAREQGWDIQEKRLINRFETTCRRVGLLL